MSFVANTLARSSLPPSPWLLLLSPLSCSPRLPTSMVEGPRAQPKALLSVLPKLFSGVAYSMLLSPKSVPLVRPLPQGPGAYVHPPVSALTWLRSISNTVGRELNFRCMCSSPTYPPVSQPKYPRCLPSSGFPPNACPRHQNSH